MIKDKTELNTSAGPKEFFGKNRRYVIWPVHTQNGVEWVVGDADHVLSNYDYVFEIRRSASKKEAMEGLK